MNTRCFAYKENGTCFALKELYCKKEHCSFYKDRNKAKKEFMKDYNRCKDTLNNDIVKHFKNL